VTTLRWRQQVQAAFRSAIDATSRVTGSREAMTMTALDCALTVAEPLIRADERERVAAVLRENAANLASPGNDYAAAEVLYAIADDLTGGDS
jgi:hypothetical protein